MPYKSEKINLSKKIGLDRRIKLTSQDKTEIRKKYFHPPMLGILSETISQRSLAKEYGVSRRLIVWTLYPERLKHNKQLRQERGGWKQYYSTKANTKAIGDTRRYKQKLYLKGII